MTNNLAKHLMSKDNMSYQAHCLMRYELKARTKEDNLEIENKHSLRLLQLNKWDEMNRVRSEFAAYSIDNQISDYRER